MAESKIGGSRDHSPPRSIGQPDGAVLASPMGARDWQNVLSAALGAALPTADFSPDKNFAEHGGDSLSFVSFILTISNAVPDELIEQIRPDLRMSQIVEILNRKYSARQSHSVADEIGVFQPNSVKSIGATANRFAFMLRMQSKVDSWIIVSDAYKVNKPFIMDRFIGIVRSLVDKFDGLRMRLNLDRGLLEQIIIENLSIDINDYVTVLSGDKIDNDLSLCEEIEKCARRIRLDENIFRVVVIADDDIDEFEFIVLIHHVASDAISNKIIREFIYRSYIDDLYEFPVKKREDVSYHRYCELYAADCLRRRLKGLTHWREQAWNLISSDPLGSNLAGPLTGKSHEVAEGNRVPDWKGFCATLKRSSGYSFEALAVAAIGEGYHRVTGRTHLNLGLVCHGRGYLSRGADARGTVGWLTEVVPTLIPAGEIASDQLAIVLRQMQSADQFGRLYGYLRYIDADAEIRAEFERHPDPNLTLNILTRSGPTSSPCPRSFGWDHVWRGERVFPLSGGLVVEDDGYRLSWEFDPGAIAVDEVERLLAACMTSLRAFLSRFVSEASDSGTYAHWRQYLSPPR